MAKRMTVDDVLTEFVGRDADLPVIAIDQNGDEYEIGGVRFMEGRIEIEIGEPVE